MAVGHYLELLRFFWRPIVAIVAASTALALLGSLFLLLVAPTYKASASVTMLPTNTELVFSKSWQGFDPAATLVQTYMEYLMSRSVAEKAWTRVLESRERSGGVIASPSPIEQVVSSAIQGVRMTLDFLNYGRFVPGDPKLDAINRLRDSIELSRVEGSFILLIEVESPRPDVVAVAANVLADAYLERVQEDLTAAASGLVGHLQSEIAARLNKIDQLCPENSCE